MIWPLLHTFQEIQNEKNAGDIKEVLGYEMEKLLLVQRELVEEIIGERICELVKEDSHQASYP